MPGAFRWLRIDEVGRQRVGRYMAYAAGEVVLIFVGITLALAFANNNEQRRLARLEHDLLVAIERNLVANLEELDRNVSMDERALSFLEPLLDHFARRAPWHDSLEVRLGAAMPWSSPFFVSSGYESLKQLGLHVVADEKVRDALVGLYDGTYARLQGGQDRSQWAFYEATLAPVRNRELDYVPTPSGQRVLRFRNYELALDRGELLAALSEHRRFLRQGLDSRRAAREETSRAIATVTEYLAR